MMFHSQQQLHLYTTKVKKTQRWEAHTDVVLRVGKELKTWLEHLAPFGEAKVLSQTVFNKVVLEIAGSSLLQLQLLRNQKEFMPCSGTQL